MFPTRIPKCLSLVCLVLFPFVVVAHGRAAIVTTTGSVVAVNSISGTGPHTLYTYDSSGAQTGSLTLLPVSVQASYTGAAVIGSTVYLSDVAANIYRVNSNTGAVTFLLNTGFQIEALGNHGVNLGAYNFAQGGKYQEFNVVSREAVGPELLLGRGGAGIDIVGNEIFLAKFNGSNAGDVEVHDATSGALLRVLDTNLSGMSGLGYDAFNNQFVIVTGANTGDDRLYRYSFSGSTATLISSSPASAANHNGLDVFGSSPPPPAVPEPTSLVMFSLGGVGLAFGAIRRRFLKAA